MVLIGVLGLAFHCGNHEKRFAMANLEILAVGLGSMAFHMTLKQPMQMLDEVPMLWSGLTMVYILLELEHVAPNTKYGSWLPIALTTHAIFTTLLVALTDGNLQFCLFHISFGSSEFFALYRIKCISDLEEMKKFS